jgi:hypothetical protein
MGDNITSAFARWRWVPRTAESAIDRAYPILHYPNDTDHRHEMALWWVVLGLSAGAVVGYAMARTGSFL